MWSNIPVTNSNKIGWFLVYSNWEPTHVNKMDGLDVEEDSVLAAVFKDSFHGKNKTIILTYNPAYK